MPGLVHPTTAALVVEISEATLRKDRTLKAPHLRNRPGIADYWIVNLVDRQLEVHRNPGADPARRGRFRYADVTTVAESGRIAPLAAPESPIAVADLLPLTDVFDPQIGPHRAQEMAQPSADIGPDRPGSDGRETSS